MIYPKTSNWSINTIADCEVASIKQLVSSFYDEWLIDTSRQATFTTHENTFMYELIWSDYNWRPGLPVNPKVTNSLNGEAASELNNILSTLCKEVNGFVVRAEIISMNPRSRIRTHKDRGDALYLIRRFHVPLKTNKDAFFIVEGEKFFLEEGKVYELNNSRYHSVRNNSDEARIHLIVDLLPNEYLEYESTL
jgi:hypothetical protein